MERQKFRQMLEQLHAELEQTDSVDESEGELLGDVMRDIRQVLDRSGDELGRPHSSLIGQLRQAKQHFEESHPTLTAAMGRVADALSNLGI